MCDLYYVAQYAQARDETSTDLVSPSGIEWRFQQSNVALPGRRAAHNVLSEIPGPTSYARRGISEKYVTAWRLLIDDTILRHIQKCTEAEAHHRLGHSNWSLSLQELEKFISILYVRGALLQKNVAVNDLWDSCWGAPFFSKTMPRDRFKEIMKYLRFDIRSERSSRIGADKFALVSQVWNRFIDNCISCYRPGANVTIDEQLFPTKVRCSFLQYMANKPDKFGIKFWLCVDVDSKYMLNALPYLGKDDTRPQNQSVGENVVWRLMQPFLNKGRNVTTDNFFTSVSLAQKLLSQRTTLVGTVNKARRDIPPYIKKLKLKLHETKILRTIQNDCLLSVYQAKKNKNVILLSTMHDKVRIDAQNKNKPDTVLFYNHTKYGVDVADSMAKR